MTRVLNVVQDLDDNEWTEIFEAAYDVVKIRDSKARRSRNHAMAAASGSAGDVVEAAENSDDDELMLVRK